MVDIMDRRVTRSLSNELAARQAAAAGAAAQQAAYHSSYVVQSTYHPQNYQQQQLSNSIGHGHQPQIQQQQQQQPPSISGINFHHQQQQSPVGMNGGRLNGGLGNSMGGDSGTYPRTTSEEMFLNTLMNTPLSPGTPTMEAASLGFLESLQPQPTVPLTMRGNSEELFNTWLSTTPENANQYQNNAYSGPPPTINRPRHSPRQNSRRVSSELQAIIAQQNGTWAPRTDNVEQAYIQANSYLSDDIISNANRDQKPYRPNPPEDKSGPAADYGNAGSLKNIWFNATSPMTRSRSSELRRRYAQMEGLAAPPPVDVFQKLATQGTLEGLVNPTMTSIGTFTPGVAPSGNNGRHQNNPDPREMGSQAPSDPSLSCSPAPVNHEQQIQQQQQQSQHEQVQHQRSGPTNVLTDVVGLLKGSLERKKLQTKQQQQMPPQQQLQMVQQRQIPPQHQDPQAGVRSRPPQESQQGMRSRPTPMSSPQVSGGLRARQEESLDNPPQDHRQHLHGDNGMAHSGGQVQQNSGMLLVRSPDESSCGAPSHSAGIATSDGPSNSGMSVHRQALKRGSGSGAVDQPLPKRQQTFSGVDTGPCIGENLENDGTKSDLVKKSDQLTRAGSITSSLRTGFQLNELDGDTRKRRVERQRKMAEAKGRGNAPPIPADMHAAVKRCEALEKEVRSLKLNLSFMNRKDSEQTKKIEELEEENDELKEERDRLLDELDRVSTIN